MVSFPKVNVRTGIQTAKKTVGAIQSEMKSTGRYYRDNAQVGWKMGKRLSNIKGYGNTKSFIAQLRGVIAKTNMRKEDIPIFLAGVGTVSPLPGGSVLGYGIGKAINHVLKMIK